MAHKPGTLLNIASLGLSSDAQGLLSEMAQFMERPLDQTANIAVHVAYLDYLNQRHAETKQAIQCLLRSVGRNDDELPF